MICSLKVFYSFIYIFPVGDSPLFGWADNVPYGETFLAVGGNQLEGDTGPETQLTTIYIFNKVWNRFYDLNPQEQNCSLEVA